MAKKYNFMPDIFLIFKKLVSPNYHMCSLGFNNPFLVQLGFFSNNFQCPLLTKFCTFELNLLYDEAALECVTRISRKNSSKRLEIG